MQKRKREMPAFGKKKGIFISPFADCGIFFFPKFSISSFLFLGHTYRRTRVRLKERKLSSQHIINITAAFSFFLFCLSVTLSLLSRSFFFFGFCSLIKRRREKVTAVWYKSEVPTFQLWTREVCSRHIHSSSSSNEVPSGYDGLLILANRSLSHFLFLFFGGCVRMIDS